MEVQTRIRLVPLFVPFQASQGRFKGWKDARNHRGPSSDPTFVQNFCDTVSENSPGKSSDRRSRPGLSSSRGQRRDQASDMVDLLSDGLPHGIDDIRCSDRHGSSGGALFVHAYSHLDPAVQHVQGRCRRRAVEYGLAPRRARMKSLRPAPAPGALMGPGDATRTVRPALSSIRFRSSARLCRATLSSRNGTARSRSSRRNERRQRTNVAARTIAPRMSRISRYSIRASCAGMSSGKG